ncbi:MAG: hypothetical protein Kow0031_40400 [Anaerolineae bacterium]
MACQSNANRNKIAAIKCGISSTASTAAYTAASGGAVLAGSLAGGVTGAALGSPLGPAGMVIGGTVGGSLGATLVVRQVKSREQEQRWRRSDAGQAAAQTRAEKLAALEADHKSRARKLKIRKDRIKADFEAAKEAGLAALEADGAGKKAGAKVAARGALNAAAAGAAAFIGAGQMGGYPAPGRRREQAAQGAALAEGLRQASDFQRQVQAEKEATWLKSKAGQTAQVKFNVEMRQWQIKSAAARSKYKDHKEAIEGAYQRRREAFLAAEK